MTVETIPAEHTDFAHAMQALALACQVLEHIDWAGLDAMMSDQDGMLCFRDPTLFMQVQADRHWDSKVGLVRAAANFMSAVRSIKSDLGGNHG